MTMRITGMNLVTNAVAGFLGGALSFLLFAGQSVRAQDESSSGVIRAKEFQLVDPSGRARAKLTFSANGEPYLAMSDPSGNHVVWLGLSEDSGLALRDIDGKTRLVMSLDKSGDPSLVVRDRQHRMRSFSPE
jgi:hypothetical protein